MCFCLNTRFLFKGGMTIPNNMIQRCVSSLLRLIFLIQFYRNHHWICTESVEEKSNSKILYGHQNTRRLPASKRWVFAPIKISKRILRVSKKDIMLESEGWSKGIPWNHKGCTVTIIASWRFKLASYKAICYIGNCACHHSRKWWTSLWSKEVNVLGNLLAF